MSLLNWGFLKQVFHFMLIEFEQYSIAFEDFYSESIFIELFRQTNIKSLLPFAVVFPSSKSNLIT